MNTFAVLHHLEHREQRGVEHFDLNLGLSPEAAPLRHSPRHHQPQSLLQHLLEYLLYDTDHRLSFLQHLLQYHLYLHSNRRYYNILSKPKGLCEVLSRVGKIRCFTKALFNYGAWNFVRIANELQQPRETVRRICLETETPVSHHITTGHTSFYTLPVMRRFIEELQRSPSAHRLNFTALAHRVGSTPSNSTVSRYLRRHGYRRCRAKPKPFLAAATRQKRLEWAQAHAHWDASDWARVIGLTSVLFIMVVINEPLLAAAQRSDTTWSAWHRSLRKFHTQ